MYILPNRKAFSDSITRIFLKYRKVDGISVEDEDEDLCNNIAGATSAGSELFSYQKIVREYLLMETPYRGLLLYHGLGSGKTCSSIAVAESLMHDKKVFVLLPASLQANYRGEIRKCGDPIYAYEQHWTIHPIKSPEDKALGRSMGISETFLDKNGRFFTTAGAGAGAAPANFRTLPKDTQDGIRKQIDDILEQRFNFINYNGLSSANVDKILPPEMPDMFDDSVVIIDEAHNLIGSVVNDRLIKRKLYDMIYNARNCKVVCLSGTPVINRPHEISFLMNLLRGPIERISIPVKSVAWDETAMTAFFHSYSEVVDVDTVEYNSVKRVIMLTRNPPFFKTIYNEKGERIAVKYDKDFIQEPDIKKWVAGWKSAFETKFAGNELALEPMFVVEKLECLPTNFEEFMNTFVDGLSIKNPLLFMRRIQGLVSYFKGADERMLPKRIGEDETLQKIQFSQTTFLRYLEARWEEIQRDSKRGRMKTNLNEDFGSYRMTSRLACNYAIPPELRAGVADPEGGEDVVPEKPEVLEKLKANPEKYLSPTGLKEYSPKMLQMLVDIKGVLSENPTANQFIYSQYKSLEGLGVFGAVLEANGFQPYRLIKKGGIWEEDPSMKVGIPAYAMFVGGDEEQRELYRQIFNNVYSDTFPQGLKDSIKEKRLCILMASSAGAEGITLSNVRNVYIMEAYWNPSRIDQVIGRAIRICSHARLPVAERTVRVRMYLSVFTPDQAVGTDGPNVVSIRRNDMVLRRYTGETEPRESFMTSDEFLYEVAYEKGRIIKNLALLLKQAAIDCEIHRKLHSREKPVIQCMRFDTTASSEDLAFRPSIKSDELDTLYMKNVIRRARKLQKVRIKGFLMILDPDTGEIFDASAFDDNNRLLRIGQKSSANQIKFILSGV